MGEMTIGEFLVTLSAAFPTGGDEAQDALFKRLLLDMDPDPRDLFEAAQRILHTRNARTMPPFAEMKSRIDESRADRLRARDAELLAEGQRLRTESDAEYFDVWAGLARLGVTHCDERGWMTGGHRCRCNVGRRPEEEIRCHGGDVPLPEARAKLEWARKQAEQEAPDRF